MTALGEAMADLRFERARAAVARREERALECEVAAGMLDHHQLGLYRADHADALDGSAAAGALWRFWRLALAASAAIGLLLVLAAGPADARPRKARGGASAEASKIASAGAGYLRYDGTLVLIPGGTWSPLMLGTGTGAIPVTGRTTDAEWEVVIYRHPLTPDLAQFFARRRR